MNPSDLLLKVAKKISTVTRSKKKISTQGTLLENLSLTQEMFVKWNAERLRIPYELALKRYLLSWEAIKGGHKGFDYRLFNDVSYQLYQVFFDDSEFELYSAYEQHSKMHFLRMLSYPDHKWDNDDRIINLLHGKAQVSILDYGCGLAQKSRALAQYLKKRGVEVRLFLLDIPTIRQDFLVWLGKQTSIDMTFVSATTETPIPKLPNVDVCFVVEFFEHVYEPDTYFEAINKAVNHRGVIVTNVMDHKAEFMHVSPNLMSIRSRLNELGYEEIQNHCLYQKVG